MPGLCGVAPRNKKNENDFFVFLWMKLTEAAAQEAAAQDVRVSLAFSEKRT